MYNTEYPHERCVVAKDGLSHSRIYRRSVDTGLNLKDYDLGLSRFLKLCSMHKAASKITIVISIEGYSCRFWVSENFEACGALLYSIHAFIFHYSIIKIKSFFAIFDDSWIVITVV